MESRLADVEAHVWPALKYPQTDKGAATKYQSCEYQCNNTILELVVRPEVSYILHTVEDNGSF